ncbi:MAG: hypothetical protein K2Y21_04660 [Phycisphaerales bacterium]|nr:hypothetical protein [Phycisphaerales bacterium]
MRPHSDPASGPNRHHQLVDDLRRTRTDSLRQPPSGMIDGIIDQLPERGNPRLALHMTPDSSARRTPHRRRSTALLLSAAATLALTTVAWFFLHTAPTHPTASAPSASETLSKSLAVLPKSGFAQLLTAPVERETRSLVLHTQRTTDSLRFSLPITRLP